MARGESLPKVPSACCRNLRADLAAITAPVLVMAGDRDQLLSRAWAGHLAGAIPAARLLVVEGADHFVATARPDAFYAAVREFLDASGDRA